MNEKPERGIDTPNFQRLAQELNRRFKNPYKAADMLLTIAGPMLKEDETA